MSWGLAHEEAIVLAADAREELEIEGFDRIDVFEAIVASGLKLMFRPLKGVAGFYEPARGRADAGVLINAGHPLALQRYSAAHELGHHLFGHGRQVDRDGEPLRGRPTTTPEEQRAEAFASWFLMPPETAHSALLRLGIEQPATELDTYALALRLGVSFRAMCTHLPSLRLVNRRTAEAWSQLPLKSIKQRLTDEPPPGGWVNDVWQVTVGDAESTLYVRAGDSVWFDLPAAGVVEAPNGVGLEEVPASDLLGVPRLRAAVAVDCLPGPAQVVVEHDGREHRFALMVARPLRGRYFSRIAVTR
jgi:Zn-dependent peptidase ImmA (M78 family)